MPRSLVESFAGSGRWSVLALALLGHPGDLLGGGRFVVVRVIDTARPAPARDTWLTVIGTFHGVGPDGIPELAATTQPQPAPPDPYE